VPATLVAEVCYMISRYRFGTAAEAALLRSFANGDLVVGNLVEEDFERMASSSSSTTTSPSAAPTRASSRSPSGVQSPRS